jgi:hypothetical protein
VNPLLILGRFGGEAHREKQCLCGQPFALYNTGGFAHNLAAPQGTSRTVLVGRGLRMRIGSTRTLLIAIVFTASMPIVRAEQPQGGEVEETVESEPRSQSSGGLKVEPARASRRLDAAFETFSAQAEPAPRRAAIPQVNPPQTNHRFWDRTNDLWFAAVGAGRAFDYASTLNLRRRGVDEIFLTNSIVDNHALFGGIEAAGTAASIAVSYLFHRTGHHRLERWTSIVHFGVATGGAARNYALKTPHHP